MECVEVVREYSASERPPPESGMLGSAQGRNRSRPKNPRPSFFSSPAGDAHEMSAIFRKSLHHERSTLAIYNELLPQVAGESVMLEEYSRDMISIGEMQIGEADKMLRKPGDIGSYASAASSRAPNSRKQRLGNWMMAREILRATSSGFTNNEGISCELFGRSCCVHSGKR